MKATSNIVGDFREALAETVAWSIARELRNVSEAAFRSPELRPSSTDDWSERVQSVRIRRQRLLAKNRIDVAARLNSFNGRLLAFDPQQSLSDGAAQVESRGFFDLDNIPPWDFWVAYLQRSSPISNAWKPFDSFLVCWIPPACEDVVERSIAVNPERCIDWAKNIHSPLIRDLRAGGLLF